MSLSLGIHVAEVENQLSRLMESAKKNLEIDTSISYYNFYT